MCVRVCVLYNTWQCFWSGKQAGALRRERRKLVCKKRQGKQNVEKRDEKLQCAFYLYILLFLPFLKY